jgi:hypothetical protein
LIFLSISAHWSGKCSSTLSLVVSVRSQRLGQGADHYGIDDVGLGPVELQAQYLIVSF